MAYTLGANQQTLLTLPSPNNWTVVAMVRCGGAFSPPNRPIWLYFHTVPAAPTSVYVNQIQFNPASSLSALGSGYGWYFDASTSKRWCECRTLPVFKSPSCPDSRALTSGFRSRIIRDPWLI